MTEIAKELQKYLEDNYHTSEAYKQQGKRVAKYFEGIKSKYPINQRENYNLVIESRISSLVEKCRILEEFICKKDKKTMKVKIISTTGGLPAYQTEGSAGMDLRANLNSTITIYPNQRVLIPTGLSIELPIGYEAQIRPRSGLALKQGVTVLNSPGTIDSDYRGEIGVILINHSRQIVEVKSGDRIAQMVITKYERIEWDEVYKLGTSERGIGGFGSTGK